MTENWYNLTEEQLAARLNTDFVAGLSHKKVKHRARQLGANLLYPVPKASFRSYLRQVLTDFTSILLLLVALLAACFGNVTVGVTVAVMLLIHYGLTVAVYIKAQKVLEGCGSFSVPTAKVLREGKLYLIPAGQLVPGDVVLLSAGDVVPADCRLIKGESLTVLEGTVTDCVEPVAKSVGALSKAGVGYEKQTNMLFATSILMTGTARAAVCDIGDDTAVRQLKRSAAPVTHEQLGVFAVLRSYCKRWSLIMLALAFGLTIADLFLGLQSRSLFDIFLTGLSLCVAAMSELYLAFGFVIVAFGVFDAREDLAAFQNGVIYKNVEKLGTLKDIDCLILPKTGCFTVRRQQVEKVYREGRFFDLSEPEGKSKKEELLRYAVLSTGLYGTGRLTLNNMSGSNVYTPEEDAIIAAAEAAGVYNISLDEQYPLVGHRGVDAGSLMHTTMAFYDGEAIVSVRGEVDTVVDRCHFYTEKGLVYHMTAEKANELKIAAQMMTKQSFHMVAVATKVSAYQNLDVIGAAQSALVFEGFLAIREPLTAGTGLELDRCRSAGIHVVMLCDDISENNRCTAEAAGLVTDRDQILTGPEMDLMGDGVLRINIRRYRLYEGLSLPQKQRLIRILRESGCRVAYLGSQPADLAPMLEADYCFASAPATMDKKGRAVLTALSRAVPVQPKGAAGHRGCQAVCCRADALIAESDLGGGGVLAVTDAIGRAKNIYKNLHRMVQYLLVSGLMRFFVVLYSVFTHDILMSPVQILFTGLAVDFSAVLIIAFERPGLKILLCRENTEGALLRPFRGGLHLMLFALFSAVCTVALPRLAAAFGVIGGDAISTVVFIGILFSQVMVLCEIKKDSGLFVADFAVNRLFLLLVLLLAVTLAAGMLLPGFGVLLGLSVMDYRAWCVTLLLPILTVIPFEIYKAVTKGRKKKKEAAASDQ